jgi:hypothetical protein
MPVMIEDLPHEKRHLTAIMIRHDMNDRSLQKKKRHEG